MYANGTFFSLSAPVAEQYLQELKGRHCNGNTNILIAALEGASTERRKSALSNGFVMWFLDNCKSVFETTNAVYTNLKNVDHADSLAVAWYPKDNQNIFPAAHRIQERIKQAPIELKLIPTYYSVAADELSAFMQVTSAEEDEIVTDPLLLSGKGDGSEFYQAGKVLSKYLPLGEDKYSAALATAP